MSEALEKGILVAEILIIKRDFDLLSKIMMSLNSEIILELIPYSALLCYEALEYMDKRGKKVDIEQNSSYSIKDIRNKAKFFDLSFAKLLQIIENVDQNQNDYYISLMANPNYGRWNAHDNIGIYFNRNKKIVGNTHYQYYIFQDNKLMSKDKKNGHVIEGKEIYSFAKDMGRIIGGISQGLSVVSDFMSSTIIDEKCEIFCQDFNTNRCTTMKNIDYKKIRLFLLHVLSSIGMLLYVLKKIIIRENGLLLRLEYITYHYTIVRLEAIKKFLKEKEGKVEDQKLLCLLSQLDFENNNKLRSSSFRNCMMHFGLINKEGKSLIDENNIDFSKPLCGLVESQFKLTYEEYKLKLEQELTFIYNMLSRYLEFEDLLSLYSTESYEDIEWHKQ
ncbi:hypothetical protein LJC02_01970 [Breznakia sp. OttesenSCG-928-G09]|nr:hypothetical protein [Breznakia sp. OttesenSCG-928-G09]